MVKLRLTIFSLIFCCTQLSLGRCFLGDKDALHVPTLKSIEFNTFDGSFLKDIYDPICGTIVGNMKTAYDYVLLNLKFSSIYKKQLDARDEEILCLTCTWFISA